MLRDSWHAGDLRSTLVSQKRNPHIRDDFFEDKERRTPTLLGYGHGKHRGSRLSQVASQSAAPEIEALGEDRRRHVLFGETSDVGSGYQLGKTGPIAGRCANNAVCHHAADYRRFDPQHGCRLPIVEKAFGKHFDVSNRLVLSQIFGQEEITSDPRKSFCVPDRREIAVNDSSDYASEAGMTAQIVRHGVAQSD